VGLLRDAILYTMMGRPHGDNRIGQSTARQGENTCPAKLRGETAMPFYTKGDVRIHYEEAGSGCIGGPFVLKLMERAPDRVVAGVLCQPSGHRPENPDVIYNNNIQNWGPTLCARRPDIAMETVDAYLHALYRSPGDFVYSVTRDFVRTCQTPMLVMPDDTPAHPYAVSMEIVQLAPHAEVTMYPWKEPKDLIPQAMYHVRGFLRAHQPVTVAC
jgi:hypothetical protein